MPSNTNANPGLEAKVQRLVHRILGGEALSLDDKLKQISYLFASILATVFIFPFYFSPFPDISRILVIASALVFTAIYVLYRFFRMELTEIWILCQLILFGIMFIYNGGGSFGAIPPFLLFPCIFSVLFLKGWRRILFIALSLVLLAVLMTYEFQDGAAILQYASEQARFLDTLSSLAIISVAISVLVGVILRELRREREKLRDSQAALIQSEKMAALGQLISGIAHEINTPLGAIRASGGNISQGTRDFVALLKEAEQRMSPVAWKAFFELVQKAVDGKKVLSAKEERSARKSIANILETNGVTQAEAFADQLVDIGVYGGVESLLPLFREEHAAFILKLAYNLTAISYNASTILSASQRAEKVVYALRSFARMNHGGERVPAKVSEGIDIVLTLYHNQMKSGIELVKEFEDLPEILCYPDELNQVWTNLIHNALQAMDYQGTLRIALLANPSAPRELLVRVTDTGKGIPESIKARIFEPFFTTKPSGEGTGLGLDIARKIVLKHGGNISVESEPGCTCFTVTLPMEGQPS